MQKASNLLIYGLFTLVLFVSMAPMAYGQEEKRERIRWRDITSKEKPDKFDKHTASEFGHFIGFSTVNLDELNRALQFNGSPTFDARIFNTIVVAPIGFTYLKTFSEGWVAMADFGIGLDERRRSPLIDNRVSYVFLKGRFGRDVLKDEVKRLIPFVGVSLGGMNFNSTLRNPENLSFADISGATSNRNMGSLNATVIGFDLGLQYEGFRFFNKGATDRYTKYGLSLGYHYPGAVISRDNIADAPELRPEGAYLTFTHTFSRMGRWN